MLRGGHKDLVTVSNDVTNYEDNSKDISRPLNFVFERETPIIKNPEDFYAVVRKFNLDASVIPLHYEGPGSVLTFGVGMGIFGLPNGSGGTVDFVHAIPDISTRYAALSDQTINMNPSFAAEYTSAYLEYSLRQCYNQMAAVTPFNYSVFRYQSSAAETALTFTNSNINVGLDMPATNNTPSTPWSSRGYTSFTLEITDVVATYSAAVQQMPQLFNLTLSGSNSDEVFLATNIDPAKLKNVIFDDTADYSHHAIQASDRDPATQTITVRPIEPISKIYKNANFQDLFKLRLDPQSPVTATDATNYNNFSVAISYKLDYLKLNSNSVAIRSLPMRPPLVSYDDTTKKVNFYYSKRFTKSGFTPMFTANAMKKLGYSPEVDANRNTPTASQFTAYPHKVVTKTYEDNTYRLLPVPEIPQDTTVTDFDTIVTSTKFSGTHGDMPYTKGDLYKLVFFTDLPVESTIVGGSQRAVVNVLTDFDVRKDEYVNDFFTFMDDNETLRQFALKPGNPIKDFRVYVRARYIGIESDYQIMENRFNFLNSLTLSFVPFDASEEEGREFKRRKLISTQ